MAIFTCPKCQSHHVQSIPVIVMAGTRYEQAPRPPSPANSVVLSFQPDCRHQTALARDLDMPPSPMSLGLLWPVVAFFAVAFPGMALSGDSEPAALLSVLVLSVVIAGALYLKVVQPRSARRREEWRAARDEWEKSFFCHRCGNHFVPAGRVAEGE